MPDLPTALSALVMSMVSLDPAARPASAGEVYDRLCAIAELPRRDDAALGQAFLTTPKLVARDEPLAVVRRHMLHGQRGRGGALLVAGDQGVGRTRFLERCVLESKLTGSLVLQGLATDADRGEYGLLQALAEQILAATPEQALEDAAADAAWLAHPLPELGARLAVQPALEPDDQRRRQRVHDALLRWFQASAQSKHVVIAIDDLHAFDEPSLAVIVGLVRGCTRMSLNLIVSLPLTVAVDGASALRVIVDHSTRDCDAPANGATLEQQSGIFLAPTGDCYQLVLLRTPAADRPVAALQIEPGQPGTIAFELIQGLGQALFEAGDVTVSKPADG